MSCRSSFPASRLLLAALMLATLLIASCSHGPGRVDQPTIDASSAGSMAMEQYDTNQDGKVAGDELEKAPALKSALARLDTDGDNGVSADEVAVRIDAWKKTQIGLMSFAFKVTLDGVPLTDATVTFEPETFLGSEIKRASGTTNRVGSGSGTIAKEDRPTPDTPSGMQLGLYKVKISKLAGGKEAIPAKYNTETTLGQEVATDAPEISQNRVTYALSTK